jgi:hypothetical protein
VVTRSPGQSGLRSARGDAGGERGGGRDQAGEHDALRAVQRAGRFPRQRARGGIDADEVAAEWQQVEPRLEDLRLAPPRLDRPCGARLRQLLQRRPRAAAPQRRIEQPGQLHRDRARTPRASRAQPITHRPGGGAPVDAAVAPEAPVLAANSSGAQRRGDTGKRHPVELADAGIGAAQIEQAAVAVEQPGFARVPRGANRGVVGGWGGSGDDYEGEQGGESEQAGPAEESVPAS